MNNFNLPLLKNFKHFIFSLFLSIFILIPAAAQTSYLGLDGGFEGNAEVDNSISFDQAQSSKWTRNGITQSISIENTIIRSGTKSLKASNTLTGAGRRIWSPLITTNSTTSNLTIQFYRYITNDVDYQKSRPGIGDGTTNDTYSSYDVPPALTWEKVTYTKNSWTYTTIAGVIWNIANNSNMSFIYFDDVVVYTGSVDNTAPDSPLNFTISSPTTTSAELSWAAPTSGTDGGGYLVVRGTVDPTTAPNINGIYATGNSIGNGTVVYQGTSTNFNDNNLNSSTTYYYRVYTYDKAYNYSVAQSLNFTTETSESDYFKSKASGNWNENTNWQSSYNNTDWVSSTIYPSNNANTIVINNDNEITIDQPVTTNSVIVSENTKLNINSSATIETLTLNPTAQLTLGSGANYEGITLNIESNENGTATIIDNGATLNITQSTVNQHLPTIRNWYITTPVNSASPSDMSKIYAYNEATNAWNETNTLNAGKGYIVIPSTGIDNISFLGTLNNGDIAIQLTKSATNTAKPGFNLIGNPYPSYINWPNVYSQNASLLSTATMWYRTQIDGNYTFWTCNGVSGIGSPASASQYIPPLQAFWVRTNDNGAFSFSNSMRSHSSVSNLLKSPAQKTDSQKIVRLQVSNGTQSDETVLYFDSNAKNDFDVYDSPKMINNNLLIPEIYTEINDEKLAINGLHEVPVNTEIPLGFSTLSKGTFTIKNIEMSNFDSNINITLIDKFLNTCQTIELDQEYQFQSDITSTTNRFSLVFSTSVVTNQQSLKNESQFIIEKSGNNTISVSFKNNSVINATISIYTLLGQKIISKSITNTDSEVTMPKDSGIYIIEIVDSENHFQQKILF